MVVVFVLSGCVEVVEVKGCGDGSGVMRGGIGLCYVWVGL